MRYISVGLLLTEYFMMTSRLGRFVILVNDYNDALNFYQKAFGATVWFDKTTEAGQRFLHIGFSKTDSAGIWFLQATGEESQRKVGRQTGGEPLLVVYTDNLRGVYDNLLELEARISREPVFDPDYSYLHCLDLYGNEIVVVELKV